MSEPEEDEFYRLCRDVESASDLDTTVIENKNYVKPRQSDGDGKSEKADTAGKSEKADTTGKSDKADTAGKSEKADTSGKLEKADTAKDDVDPTLQEIDSFLADSVDLRAGTFAQDNVKAASTPKTKRSKSVSGSEYDEIWEKIEKYYQKNSTSPEENRPVANSKPEPVEESKREDSMILAGNLYDRNGKILDVSILDVDDGLDDIVEMTVDQILQDITLLDSDDEEDTIEDVESTVINTKKESEKPKKTVAAEKTKPKEQKINWKDVKNIDVKYYKELEVVYNLYKDHENVTRIPSMKEIRTPRIFRDQSKNIIGFESLEEYIDNNHPLWCDLRHQFNQLMCKMKRPRDVAEFVHNQWDNGQSVDINQNLGCFPRKKRGPAPADRSGRERRGPGGKTDQSTVVVTKHDADQTLDEVNKMKLMDMYQSAMDNEELRHKEEERYELYISTTNTSTTEAEKPVEVEEEKRMECNFCFGLCLCSPSAFKRVVAAASSAGRRSMAKRRRWEDPVDSKQPDKRRKLSLKDCQNIAIRSQDSADLQKVAYMLDSIEESHNFNLCYAKDPERDANLMKEMLSLEAVYSDFEKYYTSPYARENPPREADDSASSYTKFIEDY